MIVSKNLGLQDYQQTWQAMQAFTQTRVAQTADEIWLVEHPAVYTLGLNGKYEHILNPTGIPVIKTDRGGQVTYHGPGQVVIYTLLDIRRLQINIRQLVSLLEQAMVDSLAHYQIAAIAKVEAPGVYVDGKKIGSIGLKIKNHCSYHGLSLNNQMDLRPFLGINPCGYAGLEVTQLADLGVMVSNTELADRIIHTITTTLQP